MAAPAANRTFYIKGLDRLQKILKQAEVRATPLMSSALYNEAQDIMSDADRLVPRRFGPLASSGHVQRPLVKPTSVEVTMGYGGASAPYAVIVHEDLEARHSPPHGTGGEAKFLEKPMMARVATLAKNLAMRIERALLRG